jgi:hypothetical protein
MQLLFYSAPLKKNILLIIIAFCCSTTLYGQTRWSLQNDGSIAWEVKPGDAHTDNIEMSGKYISLIATYGVNEKSKLILTKQLVFPMLRTIPNDTHASLIYSFGPESEPVIRINKRIASEEVTGFSVRGILAINGTLNKRIKVSRVLFPSTDKPLAIEKCTIENTSADTLIIEIEDFEKKSRTQRENSVYDVYEISARSSGAGNFSLKPGGKLDFSVVFQGRKLSEPLITADAEREFGQRQEFIGMMFNNLKFESPDSVLNRMFDFAKIRAMESIFETKGGLVHSPGGGSYYAAIWANDQAEYANPFFAYTGYPTAITAGMVAWTWFSKYMNPEYNPIPSSIIAEGTDFWNGAGDRGDQAMIAYGAGRYALALGDRKAAEELWPLIEWCIEYSRRKINKDGVISSDSDELEGRFPAGEANLCTSSLLYDALNSAIYLGTDLGKSPELISSYKKMAKDLKLNIEKYFGANVAGFDTYRYYAGNDVLRSWICIPLTVGILDRSKGTLDALFSKELWTDQGLLTQAGSTTFWDRSTLYGLRGAFAAGATERGLKFLTYYSNKRLLGEHVPYAVEAWPEGNQRHLSAESALYCRVVTEGIFGFRPDGLNAFRITPQLPGGWNRMALKNIVAFGGKKIDINVESSGSKIMVIVNIGKKMIKKALIENGKTLEVKL